MQQSQNITYDTNNTKWVNVLKYQHNGQTTVPSIYSYTIYLRGRDLTSISNTDFEFSSVALKVLCSVCLSLVFFFFLGVCVSGGGGGGGGRGVKLYFMIVTLPVYPHMFCITKTCLFKYTENL